VDISIAMVVGGNGVRAWRSNANQKIVHQCAHGLAIRHNAINNVVQSVISQLVQPDARASTPTVAK
jgi:hypothetical protein